MAGVRLAGVALFCIWASQSETLRVRRRCSCRRGRRCSRAAAAAAYDLLIVLIPMSLRSLSKSSEIVYANVKVASSGYVGLALVSDGFGRGLEVRIPFFICGKEVPPQNIPRVLRGETL